MWREQQRHVINVHQKLKRWFKFGVVSSKLMVGSAEAEKSSLVEVPLIITWLYLQINIWIPLPYLYWEVISKPWGLDGWKHSAIQNKSVLQAHAYLTFWQYCFAERSFSPPWYLFWHISEAILFGFSLHFAKKNKPSWLPAHKPSNVGEGWP